MQRLKYFLTSQGLLHRFFTIYLSLILFILLDFVSYMLLAWVAPNEIAASSLVFTINFLFIGLLWSFFSAISMEHQLKERFTNAFQLLISTKLFVIYLIFTFLILTVTLNIKFFLISLDQPQDIIPAVTSYYKIFSYGVPAFVYMIIQANLLIARKETRKLGTACCFFIFSSTIFVTIFLNSHIFNFSHEINGLACAIVIASWITCLPHLAKVCYQALRNKKLSLIKVDYNFSQHLYLSTSLMTEFLVNVSLFVILTFVMGIFGKYALASTQISNQVSLIFLQIPVAFTMVIIPFFYTLHFDEEYNELKESLKKSLYTLSLIILPICSLLFVLAKPIISAYLLFSHLDTIDLLMTITFLKITSIGLFLNTIRLLLKAYLKAIGLVNIVLLVTLILSILIGVPVSYYIAHKQNSAVLFRSCIPAIYFIEIMWLSVLIAKA